MLKTHSQLCTNLGKQQQKKQYQNFTKEQQKFCEHYKWLNTILKNAVKN